MVSKRTGKPVGRPRKPRLPAPRRPVGRPAQPFPHDPDRYAVVLLDAMLALEMGSERECSIAVAAWEVGVPLQEQRADWTGWALKPTRMGAAAATLEGRAATLRGKQRRTRSAEEGRWRTAMASAFMLVLGARDPEAVKAAVLTRAQSVDEGEFARWFMLPWLTAKISSNLSPEFPANFVSTHEAE